MKPNVSIMTKGVFKSLFGKYPQILSILEMKTLMYRLDITEKLVI